ncbi:MAG TPA: homocysteine S-methyltransferase family protein [Candidatus Polarisedimenticolia bacterium]|nr:homocysteine S-methyltransferase family protein [Candidatus Polarisedimenticolia bacterium]
MILDRLRTQTLILDGSMGALLQGRGLPSGYAPDLWNLEKPDAIVAVQREYAAAGADILLTNTFGASRRRLAEYDAQGRLKEINEAAVAIARKAGGAKVLVAGDIGPCGTTVQPFGEIPFSEAYEIFLEQARALVAAGVDLLAIETMFDLQEMKAAVMACNEVRGKTPLLAFMTFTQDGLTDTGTDPVTAAAVLEGLGVDIVGANCSTGPEHMLPVIQKMSRATRLPIAVQPNAGLPIQKDGVTIFPMSAEEMAEFVPKFHEAGAGIVGGCCGTTPDYVSKAASLVKGKPPSPRTWVPGLRITSRMKTVVLGPGHPFCLIGEKINPTGRKKFAAALAEGRMDMVVAEARKQFEAGATALDVNVGVPLTDEPALMGKAIAAIQNVMDLPLVVDSSYVEALEQGLINYPGKALVNSINAEPERIEQIFPLVKRYGAAVIALCAEDEIPEKAADRIKNAEKILKHAEAYGVRKEDIVFDPLALVVSAMQLGSAQTLETIRIITRDLGNPTSLGLSNVSFGLPNRHLINQTFLSMAVAAGLDAAIMSPYEDELKQALSAAGLFAGRDPDCRRFIDLQSSLEVEKKSAAVTAAEQSRPRTTEEKIYDGIVEGDRESIEKLVHQALLEKSDPFHLFVDVMTPAIRHLGDLFGARKKFIPHLVAAADTMKRGVAILTPLLEASGQIERKGTIVMATVKGDIHDIGKSVCAIMLRNFGFKVVDLGRNVPHETILAAAEEHGAEIIGLSALMTTTMMQMKVVADAVRQRNLPHRVLVGGAVVTPRFATEIGADGYSKDVGDCVAAAEALVAGRTAGLLSATG